MSRSVSCADGHVRMSAFHVFVGEREIARTHLAEGARVDPDNPLVIAITAGFAAESGRLDEASTAFAKACDLGGGPDAAAMVGEILVVRHEYDAALRQFERATEGIARERGLALVYQRPRVGRETGIRRLPDCRRSLPRPIRSCSPRFTRSAVTLRRRSRGASGHGRATTRAGPAGCRRRADRLLVLHRAGRLIDGAVHGRRHATCRQCPRVVTPSKCSVSASASARVGWTTPSR